MTAEERAAISHFLRETRVPRAGTNRVPRLARAALKFGGMLLVAAGIVAGYSDGDEFNEAGCTVAQQAQGASHKVHSGQSEEGGGKQPDSGGGCGGGSGKGGGGGPPCEAPAEKCTNQLLLERLGEVVEMLAGIRLEVAAVRQEHGELRSAKQRLEKMLADGVFKFTQKVDATSFKVLCTILAEGDVAKAGRKLGIGDSMIRYMLRRWRERGGVYGTMLDLVRWRKKVGRRETVPLNEAVFLEEAKSVDYPGLLSDVLDGLLSVTGENWQELCEELASLVREAVGQS